MLGYETEACLDYRSALARIGASLFDVALVDLRLPDGAGDVLIPEILCRNPEAKVVLVSGIPDLDRVSEGEGFEIVPKPAGPDALAVALGRDDWLEGDALRLESSRAEAMSVAYDGCDGDSARTAELLRVSRRTVERFVAKKKGSSV